MLSLEHIPEWGDRGDKAPISAEVRGFTTGPNGHVARRTVLKTLIVTSAALGGSMLSWGARPFVPAARAETSPDGTSTGWDDCGSEDYGGAGWQAGQADTSGDYATWYGACLGGQYRSSVYCNGAGWHRRDTIVIDPGETYDYMRISTRCWSSDPNPRNAWKWQSKRKTAGAPFQTFRCSDGKRVRLETGFTVYTICRACTDC